MVPVTGATKYVGGRRGLAGHLHGTVLSPVLAAIFRNLGRRVADRARSLAVIPGAHP